MSANVPDSESRPPDDLATRLRGRGPAAIAAFVAILILPAPFSAFAVIGWRSLTGTPWRDLGVVRPRSWPWTVAAGIALGVALKLALKSIVMPLLGAPPINATYHEIVHNPARFMFMIPLVVFSAGIGEELVFRGFIFERLGSWFGPRRWAMPAIVALSALYFGLGHYPDQRLAGAEQAAITGLVFGAIYARTRRLPLLMVAHAAFDITAVTIIYLGAETSVAHWFLR